MNYIKILHFYSNQKLQNQIVVPEIYHKRYFNNTFGRWFRSHLTLFWSVLYLVTTTYFIFEMIGKAISPKLKRLVQTTLLRQFPWNKQVIIWLKEKAEWNIHKTKKRTKKWCFQFQIKPIPNHLKIMQSRFQDWLILNAFKPN